MSTMRETEAYHYWNTTSQLNALKRNPGSKIRAYELLDELDTISIHTPWKRLQKACMRYVDSAPDILSAVSCV